MKKMLLVVLCAAAVFGLVSCSGSSVVGTWENVEIPDLKETWEFKDGGTVTQIWDGKEIASFDYTNDNGKIAINFPDSGEHLLELTLDGYKMVLGDGTEYLKKK